MLHKQKKALIFEECRKQSRGIDFIFPPLVVLLFLLIFLWWNMGKKLHNDKFIDWISLAF